MRCGPRRKREKVATVRPMSRTPVALIPIDQAIPAKCTASNNATIRVNLFKIKSTAATISKIPFINTIFTGVRAGIEYKKFQDGKKATHLSG